MDYQTRLLAKKQEIEDIIRTKQQDLAMPLTESVNELSLYDQHPGDIGSEVYEREKDAGLLELYEMELEKINDALEKYDRGEYGICDNCKRAIEPARLERLVNTTLCAGCANELKNRYQRPPEEDVMSAGEMSDEGETFTMAGYEFYE
ncbi:MAG: TraR/DksA C4-type zinc finger protein [Syntrophomonadaceae bacterium]